MNECRHCGAEMADEGRHRRWHDEIARDVTRLQQQVQSLEERVLSPRR
ncbi:MAG: hypothetical protein JWO76_1971 [Nocardioides sp.]|nr:hypothetical protein [Nocardioides sp.]